MAQLDPADARLIAHAANTGRISVHNVPEWILAMRADAAGTRASLSRLVPVKVNMSDGAATAYASHGVEDSLRRMGVNATRPVEAAAAPLPPPEVVTGAIDQALPDGPILLTRGKPPAEWTKTERDNALLRQMFPGLRDQIPPAPGGAGYYQPTGREHSLPVQQADGSIEWVPRPDYKPTVD